MKSLVRFALLVAVVAGGGCSGPKSPPPSAFYSGVNLQALVEQCAPEGLKWGAHGSGGSLGGSPSSYRRSFHGDFQGEQDSLDTFLQALKGVDDMVCSPVCSPQPTVVSSPGGSGAAPSPRLAAAPRTLPAAGRRSDDPHAVAESLRPPPPTRTSPSPSRAGSPASPPTP